MESIATLLILSATLLFLTTSSHSADLCQPSSCHPNGPIIRFPFRLPDRQPDHCGYPNFDLRCNNRNETVLNLPNSGDFTVLDIDYETQSVIITDPDSCLPSRILNFNLSGSPFYGENMKEFTFLNCSLSWTNYPFESYMPLLCLSGEDYTVLAMRRYPVMRNTVPETCRMLGDFMIPAHVSLYYWSERELREELDLKLIWTKPDCADCEIRGGVCGFVDSGEIGCSMPSRPGLPTNAKYGIIFGVGIPGVICFLGLLSYTKSMIRTMRNRNRSNSGLPLTSIRYRHPIIKITKGLDSSTIDSFPMTVLGESRRLPNPSDTTCAVCLGDYKPKETLRSIPECNHYFHSDCIDQWLKLNGTCPLCRISPESSTPCSSMSLSSRSSSDT